MTQRNGLPKKAREGEEGENAKRGKNRSSLIQFPNADKATPVGVICCSIRPPREREEIEGVKKRTAKKDAATWINSLLATAIPIGSGEKGRPNNEGSEKKKNDKGSP